MGVVVDFGVLLFDHFGHLFHLFFELAVLGVDLDHHLFVGFMLRWVHYVISVSKFSFVIIYEDSFDWISLSVI